MGPQNERARTMIGDVIRDWRTMNRMGQRDAAKAIGVSTATMCRIEQGKSVDQVNMMKLLNWLFGTSPNQTTETEQKP